MAYCRYYNKNSKQRKYTYLFSRIRNEYEYRKFERKEYEQYIKEKFIEFVSIDKIKEAALEAWKSITPDVENLSFTIT